MSYHKNTKTLFIGAKTSWNLSLPQHPPGVVDLTV